MKPFLFVFVILASAITGRATVSLSLSGGQISDGAGNAVNDGGLLLLVVSTTDSIFSGPSPTSSLTTGSFLSGDDMILGAFSVDSGSSGIAGGYYTTLNITSYTGNLNSGDLLQLYWFPTLTALSTSTGAGTSYGTYRTDSVAPGSDISWALPADGQSVSLSFLTTSAGGGISDSLGQATLTTVPEPATTVALLGGIAGVFVMLRRRQRRTVATQTA